MFLSVWKYLCDISVGFVGFIMIVGGNLVWFVVNIGGFGKVCVIRI